MPSSGPSGLEDGTHHRLLEADDLVAAARVRQIDAPLLQWAVLRQDEIGHRSRVIHEPGEADYQGDLEGGGLELRRVGKPIPGVCPPHQQRPYAPSLHLRRQVLPGSEGAVRGPLGDLAQRRLRGEDDAALLTDAAHQVVEGVDGLQVEEAVRVGGSRAAPQRQAWAVAREVPRQLFDVLGRDMVRDPARDLCGGELLEGVGVAVGESGGGLGVSEPFGDDDVGDAEGQQPLGARVDVDPVVGVGRGHGEPGVDVDQPPALPVALAQLAVPARVLDRRQPGVQEVGAEGEDAAGVAYIEVGQHLLLKHLLDGGAERDALHGLVGQVPAAEPGHEAIDDHSKMGADGVGDHHHRRLVVVVLQSLELEGQPRDGVAPPDLLELVRASGPNAHHRSAYPVRVVERLQSRFAAGAVLAGVDGVVDVALDLLGPALHHPDQDALAGGTLAAQRCIPVVQTGDQVLGHLDGRLDLQLAFAYSACLEYDGAGCRAARQGQELSSG